MPNYDVIASKQKNISLYIEIDIIWIVYFVQIMFQLVIGLNFMIAIIESTFKSVNDEQENFIYRNKAELNLESFQILQYFPIFKTTDTFRAIIFSSFVNENESEIVIHGREDEVNNLLDNMKNNLEDNFK